MARCATWLGYWPAAVRLFAFVWTELVDPDSAFVSTIVTWCLLYAAAMLVGGAVRVPLVRASRPVRGLFRSGRTAVAMGMPHAGRPRPGRGGVGAAEVDRLRQLRRVDVLVPIAVGTASLVVQYPLSAHPTVLAGAEVVCIVTGHVAAVVAAHDRAVRLLPARHEVAGQLAMLLVMVGYTVGRLLLFSS